MEKSEHGLYPGQRWKRLEDGKTYVVQCFAYWEDGVEVCVVKEERDNGFSYAGFSHNIFENCEELT